LLIEWIDVFNVMPIQEDVLSLSGGK